MEATNHERRPSMLDRMHLIERLKRGNSPSWQHHPSNDSRATPESRPTSRDNPKTPIRSPVHIRTSRPSTPEQLRDSAVSGLEIERPRSALHSGDFREKKQRAQYEEGQSSEVSLATSPVVPWHQSFPAAARPPSKTESSYSFHHVHSFDPRPTTRARAITHSSFPSFAFMPPTSPLVQQSNNTDLDFSSRPGSRQTSRSPERNSRRHTFSPQPFHAFKSTAMARSVSGTPAAKHPRRGDTIPYQAHQPRRSLTSFNHLQPHSSPQTPFLGPRRPSCSSEASPLHHAPMVGSYEESILRGRMSTTPSRPLNFIAKIGVLGKGQCRSDLKCPPHVAVPFPAVFYSYNTGNGPISDDSPSPYVGLIDLENSLPPPEEKNESGKRRRRQTVPNPDQDGFDFRPDNEGYESRYKSIEDIRRKEKKKRRSTSPKTPPGGSYRIPQVGQLQIVIKNPNKTAVKLFLVPYDVSDMEPGQKTFVRQRSYSAGPIIDMPMSSRKNLGTDRPEASLSTSDDPNDRPILRYLIHLHICCPSKGRYYLHKSIRVVFANRVPDGKEKLRNEVQLPEPRYSTYKASRDSLAVSQAPSSAAAQLTADKAMRRRSAGISLSQNAHGQLDGIGIPSCQYPPLPPPAVSFTGGPATTSSHSRGFNAPINAIRPIPFHLNNQFPEITSQSLEMDVVMGIDIDNNSPFRSRASESMDVESPIKSSRGSMGSITAFEKLGRDVFCGVSATGAGLLAKRLRGLDVQLGEGDADGQEAAEESM
ncbi:hypothetical protein CC80DRAFT_422567 [Byssothecium circinans]|uniref:Atos-like conserved domain-containing protein n=1 Tax=Byssothecium circinans TaxID=147558 RepID=A0A6A5TNA7_9PLEO|nr:hypothetical protein CC80DRAFT_422567 [Byssothecium circinans]